MMKNVIFLKSLFVCAITLICIFCNDTYGQRRYTVSDTTENVTIAYRWQRSNIFKSDSRTVLNLHLTNTNEYPAEVKFAVGFYVSGILKYESKSIEKCFKPGQKKRGGKAGFRFQSEEFTKEDIESEGFEWDFTFFTVDKTDNCE